MKKCLTLIGFAFSILFSILFLFFLFRRGSRIIRKLQKCDGVPCSQLFPSVCVAKVSGTLVGITVFLVWLTQVVLEIPHGMLPSVQLLPYFSIIFRHKSIYSTLSWSKAQKSETVESIKEIAYKKEKQLFTIIATGVFPRNSDFVYSSAHDVSVSVVDGLMDLNWNDVPHRRGRNKCRNLGSAAVGCLLVARIWRLIDSVVQDTVS